MTDDGVYFVECERGHRTIHLVRNAKFEILFEIGLLALADGYTRESVASISAAAEEFCRLYVNTILIKRHVAGEQTHKDLWKMIRLSERLMGAFVLCHVIEENAISSFPSEKLSGFRNKVIHDGRIPAFADVEEYGQAILDFIVPLYERYRATNEMIIASVVERHEKLRARDALNGNPHEDARPLGGTSYQSAIRAVVRDGRASFASALEHARTRSFLRRSTA